jgi:hypothetical protein
MSSTALLIAYGPGRIIITVTAVFCFLLEIIDTTIVNVALNDMPGYKLICLTKESIRLKEQLYPWVAEVYEMATEQGHK